MSQYVTAGRDDAAVAPRSEALVCNSGNRIMCEEVDEFV